MTGYASTRFNHYHHPHNDDIARLRRHPSNGNMNPENVEDDDDREIFQECRHTNEDVFVFLSQTCSSETTSEASSSSSSSSTSSLHGFSCSPDSHEESDDLHHADDDDGDDDDASTTYLDASTTSSNENKPKDILEEDHDVGLHFSSSEEHDSLFSLSGSSHDDDNDGDEKNVVRRELSKGNSQESLWRLELPRFDDDADGGVVGQEYTEGSSPVDLAVQVVQNIWEGSKRTPVGFAVNLTEDLFGRLTGMIPHQDDDNDDHHHHSSVVDMTTIYDDKEDGLMVQGPNLPPTEQVNFLGPNEEGEETESIMIAEPDPLDASEFVLANTIKDDRSPIGNTISLPHRQHDNNRNNNHGVNHSSRTPSTDEAIRRRLHFSSSSSSSSNNELDASRRRRHRQRNTDPSGDGARIVFL